MQINLLPLEHKKAQEGLKSGVRTPLSHVSTVKNSNKENNTLLNKQNMDIKVPFTPFGQEKISLGQELNAFQTRNQLNANITGTSFRSRNDKDKNLKSNRKVVKGSNLTVQDFEKGGVTSSNFKALSSKKLTSFDENRSQTFRSSSQKYLFSSKTLGTEQSTDSKRKAPVFIKFQNESMRRKVQQQKFQNQKIFSTTATSFNINIPNENNFEHPHIGLLDKEYNNNMVTSTNFFSLDSGLPSSINELRDQFYDDEEFPSLAPDQKVQTELYLNKQYNKTVRHQIDRAQNYKYAKMLEQMNTLDKNQAYMAKCTNIKRYEHPQIGESYQDGIKKQKIPKNQKMSVSKLYAMSQTATHGHIRYFFEETDWHPQGRIGATLTPLDGHIYMIGGRANELISDTCILKTQKHHIQENKWMSLQLFNEFGYESQQPLLRKVQKMNQQEALRMAGSGARKFSLLNTLMKRNNQSVQEQLEDFSGRYNHTAVSWKKSIVVFGGEKEYDRERYKRRTVLNEVYFLSTIDMKWSKKVCHGDAVEPRRNHTACMVGTDMIVLGGINTFEKTCQELIYLDLTELKWKTYGEQGNYTDIFAKTGCLSYHSCCPIYDDHSKQKLHSNKFFKPNPFIKEQGVYYYGGKFKNNKINEDVYVLNTFTFPVTWKVLETTGKKPVKRYAHSMQFDHTQNVAIVAGGKTDDTDTHYLGDVYILKLVNLEWMEITFINPELQKKRGNFACCIEETQLFIFGGMNDEGLHGPKLEIQEFDQKRVDKIRQGQDLSKKDIFEENRFKIQQEQKARPSVFRSFLPLPERSFRVTKV